MNSHQVADMILTLTEMKVGRKRWTFTLEPGRGETYATNKPTLYGHSTYERSSVLAGRPQRVFVASWDNWPSAYEELAMVKKALRWFKFDDIGGGSTHIPTSQIVAHLPDDTDY